MERNRLTCSLVVFGVVGLLLVIGGSLTLLFLPMLRSAEAPPDIIVTATPDLAATVSTIARPPAPDRRPTRRLIAGAVVPLLDSDSATPDLLLRSRNLDRSTITLVYLDSTRREPRWESQPLSDDGYLALVVPGGDQVYVADQTSLLALRRSDGSLAWQVQLSDTIQNICRDCLQVFDSAVVALTQDGVLSSFAVQTGEQLWSLRLKGTPRQLLAIGDQVAVLDLVDSERPGEGATLNLFNPLDGSLLRSIEPICPDPDQFFPDTRIGIYDPIFINPTDQSLFLIFGTINNCAQRIEPASAELVWRTSITDDLPILRDDDPLLFSAEATYLASGGTLLAFANSDGSLSQVISSSDYELAPLALRDGVLLVEAQRTRGSRRVELWGIDLASGTQRWQYQLQAADRIVEPSGFGDWAVYPGPTGFAVIQQLADPDRVQVTILNIQDGSVASENQLPSTSFGRIDGILADERVAWISYDVLYVLDLQSGAPMYAWP